MSRIRILRGATDRPRSTVAGRVARGTLLLPLAAWSLVGCYAYLPAATVPGGDAALAGRTVRVTLTTEGTRRVEPALGAGVVEVEGVLERAWPDSVRVAVRQVATQPTVGGRGERFASSGSTVTVPRAAVAGLQVQQLSRSRSAMLAAGVAAALATVASLVSASFGGSGTVEPGPSPQPQRLPSR